MRSSQSRQDGGYPGSVMETRGNPRVGITAYYTAYSWTERGYPFSDRFASRTGRWTTQFLRCVATLLSPFLSEGVKVLPQFLYLRHLAHEALIARSGDRFILDAGSGLSPRGLAMASKEHELRYVDGDLPNVVEAKRRRLEGVVLPENYALEPLDLLDGDLWGQIAWSPEPGERVRVVLEGVESYLHPSEKTRCFAMLARTLRAVGGGTLQLEIYPRDRNPAPGLTTRILTRMLGALTGREFERGLWDRASDAARSLHAAGFDEVRSIEATDLAALAADLAADLPLHLCPWTLIEATVGHTPRPGSPDA